MSRQEDAALELESTAADLASFIEACPESKWNSMTSAEGWTVAALAYHCALGNDVGLGWICGMLDWRPVREISETHDASNAADAKRHAQAGKATVRDELERSTARTAGFLRSLTDAELERSAHHGLAGRELTVGQFIGNFGKHMRGHLASMQETVKT